jgi:hypothetical protein
MSGSDRNSYYGLIADMTLDNEGLKKIIVGDNNK